MTSPASVLPAAAQGIYDDYVHQTFESTTAFDYLFPDLRDETTAHLPAGSDVTSVLESLKKLGDAMVDPAGPDPDRDSTVAAIYTYWGQFIDHDITLNTNGPDRTGDGAGDVALGDISDSTFTVFPPDVVVKSIHNGRHPALNLDSLYGSGPKFPGDPDKGTTRSEAAYSTGDPIKLALGRVATAAFGGFDLVEPGTDAQRDLPRFLTAEVETLPEPKPKPGAPKIPDDRNDENLVVAQLHLGFIRFHNAVVDWVRDGSPGLDDRETFRRAQETVRFYHQWLVVNDYLEKLTKPGVVDGVLAGTPLFDPPHDIAMPLEFAVAAFRFGHSMARNGYDYNVNFGPENPPSTDPLSKRPFARLLELFEFTGGGGLRPTGAPAGDDLPSNWPIDWSRFVDQGEPLGARAARKIDPFLAADLKTMRNQGTDPGTRPEVRDLLKNLARRNLERGYWLSIPTGEAVAGALGVTPLTPAELTAGAAPEVSEALDELGGTPLWYYVLKEAEIQGGGNFLGDVGSTILAETFVYLLRQDPGSYLTAGWDPSVGVTLDDGTEIRSINDLLRFAGVLELAGGGFRTAPDGTPAGHDGD